MNRNIQISSNIVFSLAFSGFSTSELALTSQSLEPVFICTSFEVGQLSPASQLIINNSWLTLDTIIVQKQAKFHITLKALLLIFKIFYSGKILLNSITDLEHSISHNAVMHYCILHQLQWHFCMLTNSRIQVLNFLNFYS